MHFLPPPPSFEGAIENGERGLLGHSDSSMLGKSPVLSSAVVSAGCSSDQTSLSAGSSDPTSFSSYSSETRNIEPAHLVVLQGGLEKAGFSKRSAERVCAAKRASTVSLQLLLERLDGLVSRTGDGSHRSICNGFGRLPYLPV